MNNPNGPYPGRQLFLGAAIHNRPCFVYLVTGRSPESRERKAVLIDNTVRMGPVGNVPYDPLRHYSAVEFDENTGVLAVTNGIQTEAIFETYKLMINTGSVPGPAYIQMLMEGANAEPDSYHTPRIAGVIFPDQSKNEMKYITAIKGYGKPAQAQAVEARPGVLMGVSTYQGAMGQPSARDPQGPLSRLECQAKTATELADFLFDISAATYNGNDIRVCTVAGMYAGTGKWELAIRNVK